MMKIPEPYEIDELVHREFSKTANDIKENIELKLMIRNPNQKISYKEVCKCIDEVNADKEIYFFNIGDYG